MQKHVKVRIFCLQQAGLSNLYHTMITAALQSPMGLTWYCWVVGVLFLFKYTFIAFLFYFKQCKPNNSRELRYEESKL